MRRTRVLAAPALGAREPVEHFLRREVEDRRDAEAQLVVRHVEAEGLEPPPPPVAGTREPHVHRSSCDVQVL